MGKIDDLIQQYCPDGVEYKPIHSFADTNIGLATSVTAHKANEGVLLLHNSDIQQNKIVLKNVEYITSEFAKKNSKKVFKYHDIITVHTGDVGTSAVIEDEYVGCIGFTTITTRIHDFELVNPYYLAHYLNSELCKSIIATKSISDRNNLNQKEFEVLEIPVPPLPVQEEIVRILDKFTELERELEIDLKTELDMRRKQFEYYRDKVLSISDDVATYHITDVFEMKNGYTPSKSNPEYWTNGVVDWFRMEDIRANGHVLTSAIQKVNKTAVKGGRLFKAYSIMLATSATIGEHALVKVDCLGNQRFTFFTLKDPFKNIVSMDYMNYYFYILDEWCKSHLNKGNFASVDMDALKKLRIPIPDLKEQNRIVDILDRFDSLTTDITEDLPTEIKIRHQQYEYYRDKLLTFKRLEDKAV